LPGGAYERLLREDCESRTQPDPRILMESDDWRKASQEFELAKAEGLRVAVKLFEELLSVGDPVEVGRWKLHGRDGLPREAMPAGWDDIWGFDVFPDGTIAPNRGALAARENRRQSE
jgi:hypothetical protein